MLKSEEYRMINYFLREKTLDSYCDWQDIKKRMQVEDPELAELYQVYRGAMFAAEAAKEKIVALCRERDQNDDN